MANTDVVDIIFEMASTFITYMLPVIALLAGINFIVTLLLNIVFGIGRRSL